MDAVEPDAEPEPTARPPLEQRAATLLAGLAGVGLAGAVATGIPLLWAYAPPRTGGVRALHALSSSLLLGATAGLVLVLVVATLLHRPVWTGWAPAIVGFSAAAAGSLTGSLVAWDGLAVRAVTTPGDTGALAPLGDGVRFVIVGSHELSPGAYLAWLLVHVVVVGATAGVAGWLAWRRVAHRPRVTVGG